jgi:hypothetical protein
MVLAGQQQVNELFQATSTDGDVMDLLPQVGLPPANVTICP